MNRYRSRIHALEGKLMPSERSQRPFVVWMITDSDDPPEWAEEAIRPHMPTDGRIAFVEWHQSKQTGEYCVDINGQWYSVTEAGVVPMEPPITVTLDNPSDTAVRPMTPVQARDMLREAGV